MSSQKFRGRKTAPSWLPPHCPKDYSSLVRGALARSGALPFGQHGYAGRHYASDGGRFGLRYAQTYTSTVLRYAAALLRPASLSLRPLGRSVKKRCLALLRRAKIICAVWAKPSALLPSPHSPLQGFGGRKTAPSWLPPHCPKDYSSLVRGGLARSGALPFGQHSYAGRHYASDGGRFGLRYAQTYTSTVLRYAAALLRPASLSLRPLGRSTKKRYLALLRRAKIIYAVWASPSALLPRGCCSVGDACRSLRSLCRFPPPSLLPLPRYARAPPPLGGLCVFLGCAFRHFGTAYGAAFISARTKAVRSVFCAVWATPSAGRSANIDMKEIGSPPYFYFHIDNRFALSLAGV